MTLTSGPSARGRLGRGALGVALLLALGLAACAGSAGVGTLDTRPRSYKPADYEKVRRRWTAAKKVRKGFDLALQARASLLAWDLRAATIARLAAVRDWTQAELERERTRHLEEVVQWNDFIVVTRAHEYAWANLADDREKTWTIGLVSADGRVARPTLVRKLRKTAETSMLYPESDEDWSYLFLVRFPVALDGRPLVDAEAGGKLTLRFAGAPGRLDLTFAAAPGR